VIALQDDRPGRIAVLDLRLAVDVRGPGQLIVVDDLLLVQEDGDLLPDERGVDDLPLAFGFAGVLGRSLQAVDPAVAPVLGLVPTAGPWSA